MLHFKAVLAAVCLLGLGAALISVAQKAILKSQVLLKGRFTVTTGM